MTLGASASFEPGEEAEEGWPADQGMEGEVWWCASWTRELSEGSTKSLEWGAENEKIERGSGREDGSVEKGKQNARKWVYLSETLFTEIQWFSVNFLIAILIFCCLSVSRKNQQILNKDDFRVDIAYKKEFVKRWSWWYFFLLNLRRTPNIDGTVLGRRK